MNKRSRKRKYILKYISSILSWSLFSILLVFIGILGYYYCALKVYEKKGYGYAPKFSIYTIVSPSMVPTINVYDMVVNFKVDTPADVMDGDIITFKSNAAISEGLTITHRVKDIQIINGKYEYITKGDNNNVADPSPAPFENIIGKTAFKLPGFGKIQRFVSSVYGYLLVITIPALLIIIKNIYNIIKYKNVKKNSRRANNRLVSKVQGSR